MDDIKENDLVMLISGSPIMLVEKIVDDDKVIASWESISSPYGKDVDFFLKKSLKRIKNL